MLRPHYNSDSSEGILSDGERVLGEVRTTDSLIKEPVTASKNVSRKGGKVKRSKPKMLEGQRVCADDGSDNSSSCANSDLSNISDESLPSDMEEVEVCVSDLLFWILMLLCFNCPRDYCDPHPPLGCLMSENVKILIKLQIFAKIWM